MSPETAPREWSARICLIASFAAFRAMSHASLLGLPVPSAIIMAARPSARAKFWQIRGFSSGFLDGVHLAIYRESERLLDKFAFYLRREASREKIAATGRAEALEKHTCRHRMEQVLQAEEAALARIAAGHGAAGESAEPRMGRNCRARRVNAGKGEAVIYLRFLPALEGRHTRAPGQKRCRPFRARSKRRRAIGPRNPRLTPRAI